ncbi:MAG TPA: UDP-N-acetylmuramoyl-tripeptide--D-alanyl-D-alanine ligase [Gemmatimonadaceae bacterium]|nr:UDP-N-acetylmuramoyl-tripeptide--D-alanyl-D-alanine ligase [Gemmatimonadaceae bacterium]
MSFWTMQRVATALGQSADNLESPQVELAGITTDSRVVAPGQVFVALIGETFDGHDYVAKAVEQGASAVIVSRPPLGGDVNVPVFEVDDTLIALGQLGSYYRREWGGKIVAVAGSNGKTTTKDLIRAALSKSMKVHATTGNLNNRIGVPLTLLATPKDAEIAVVEVGTNIPGEVAILRDIVRPEVAVVTSVAEEHLEGLGDLEGVLREEAACYDGVEVGIAPAAQPEIGEAARGKAKRVITAGLDDGDVTPASWSIDAEGRGTIRLDDVVVSPPLRGLHNLQNTMLALAVARECGVSDADAASGISSMEPPRMRVAWETIGRATLINDAYNANPGSTRAAIDLVKGMGPERQRVIVLGTMRELGEASGRCHLDIARLAMKSGADVVAGVGEFESALNSVSDGGVTVVTAESVEELWPKLEPRMQHDAVILLKASRGVRLERLVPQLTTWATS